MDWKDQPVSAGAGKKKIFYLLPIVVLAAVFAFLFFFNLFINKTMAEEFLRAVGGAAFLIFPLCFLVYFCYRLYVGKGLGIHPATALGILFLAIWLPLILFNYVVPCLTGEVAFDCSVGGTLMLVFLATVPIATGLIFIGTGIPRYREISLRAADLLVGGLFLLAALAFLYLRKAIYWSPIIGILNADADKNTVGFYGLVAFCLIMGAWHLFKGLAQEKK